MKVAIITDQHFGARNDSVNFLDYYEKFYKETFFPRLDKENIKTVLILGDTFDRRKYVNFYTLKRAKEMFFYELWKRKITVHMLAGNHDTYFKDTNDVNSVDLILREYENITVIASPQTIHLDYENENFDICMIPWICSENHEQVMSEMQHTASKLCMGHFEIVGFGMNRNMKSEEGLGRELFKRFDMVFSGHYHHKSSSDNIQYLGNPYELTWEDFEDERGFHIFDLSDRTLEFVKNPNSMFYRITYDDTLKTKHNANKDLTTYTSKYVKVVVVNKTDPKAFDVFVNSLYNINPADLAIDDNFIDIMEGFEDVDIEKSEKTITTINKFIDSIEDVNIDNDRLKKVMNEIYVEAINLEKV